MLSAVESIFQAAHHEVAEARRLLHQEAERFNQTFLLTTEEAKELQATVDMHVFGPAIEICVPSRDIAFSLRSTSDRASGRDRWEFIAFHGISDLPHYVCTFHYGETQSDHARRLRGARLVSAVGEYLGATHVRTESMEADVRGRILEFQRADSMVEDDTVRELQQA